MPKTAWKTLQRPPRYEVRTKPRRRRTRFKQQVVDAQGYKDIRLCREEVAETTYRPAACRNEYRLVIVRKRLEVRERDQLEFFPDYRYFLYLTNDWESTPEEIVFSANDRCQQENVLAQLHGLRALHAPVQQQPDSEAAANAKRHALLAVSRVVPASFATVILFPGRSALL